MLGTDSLVSIGDYFQTLAGQLSLHGSACWIWMGCAQTVFLWSHAVHAGDHSGYAPSLSAVLQLTARLLRLSTSELPQQLKFLVGIHGCEQQQQCRCSNV